MAPDQYQLWISGSTTKSLVDASVGYSATAADTGAFLTTAKANAGWTTGDPLYFQDVAGECWTWTGNQQMSNPGLISATYGTASTSNICSGPSTDTFIHNFVRVDQSMDCTNLDISTNGQTLKETFTTASSGSTYSAVAQGSHDFWVAMGQPTGGEWITITGDDPDSCYYYVDSNLISSWNNGNVSWAGVQYNQSIPTVDTTEPDCAQCTLYLQQSATYHTWESCDTGTDRPLYVPDAFNNVPPNNDDVYNAFSTANGSNLQTGDITKLTYGETDYCFKYTGQSSGHNSFGGVDLSWTITSDTSCENCLNPSTTDQDWYNWKLHHSSCGTSPLTKSITTQGSGTTLPTQRQGSYDFWVAMGEPNIGEFVSYGQPGQDPLCWEYMGDTKSAVGATEYGVTAPTPALTATDIHTGCDACYAHINSGTLYHLFSSCDNPSSIFIGLANNTGSTAVTTAENNALYTALLTPTQGQYFQISDGLAGWYCFKYEGQGTSAQANGGVLPIDPINDLYNVGTFFNDCTTCETPPGDYHKWMKCDTSEIINLVAIGGSNTAADNTTFWVNADSPNIGDIVMLNTVAEQSIQTCYEYLGTSPSAESSVDFKAIDTPATYNDCTTCTTPVVRGCTNPSATNYNPAANSDDGSCIFISGCTDPAASNYDATATTDDGSCIYCVYGCTDKDASNYDPTATCDDGSCRVVQGGTGCTIAFGTEECQPDGTANVNIDLSGGGGLSNIVTTVNGAPFGSSTGCTTPSDILVTGLTQGQLIRIKGECSYEKEDYNSSLSAVAPGWANAICGESEQTISNDTKVYVYYDGTSLGVTQAKDAYKAVMEWLIGLNDFTVDTVHGSGTQNVFHTAVAGERWLDWAITPITGKFNNNQTPLSATFKYTGGSANATTVTHCSPGSDCYWSRTGTDWVHKPYAKGAQGSNMHKICNWSFDTNTESSGSYTWDVDTFYDTAQTDPSGTGTGRIGAPMPDGSQGSGNNSTQTFIGAPPAASTNDDVLVICFADESTWVYHPDENNFDEDDSHSSGDTQWTNISTLQPTQPWKDDYTEFIAKRNSFVAANGKSYKAFLYPSRPANVYSSHRGFPIHALATIHSGNNTPQDGKFQTGTAPTNSIVSLSLIETANPYWTGTVPTYGGLDQHGWGVNVDEVSFNATTFQTDLEVFLGSGSTATVCDDSQCLFIKAVDENGVPVSNYPITVNGVSAGTTNAGGMVSQTLSGPSSIIINDCYTFAAVGTCLQTQVTITITEAQYTTALNCILGCTDPLSWNYNPLAGIDDGTCMYPLEEDPKDSMSRCELLKIDTECQFATDIYNIYKHDRFGFERSCLNNIEGHINSKYSSDWVDRLLPDYGAETMTKTKHTKGATPKPDWVDANCGTSTGSCDGSECIVVIVENKNGDRIPDYEIVLDGLYAGKTDSLGVLRLSIPNAEEDKEHKLNLCHCFTTSGNCNSQRIKLTVDGLDCDDCGNIKMF